MKFELVYTNENQRFYKSDEEIKFFPNKDFIWDEEKDYYKDRLKDGYELLDDKCFSVCISDATTHIERLVFAAGRVKKPNGKIIYIPYSMLQIDGRMTFMTNGGSYAHVKDDEIYLRHIAMVNNKINS